MRLPIITFIFLLFLQGCGQQPSLIFEHHFIDTTLVLRDGIIGDYGLTAVADLDRDGKYDFVLGGRATSPSTLYWYQYKSPHEWTRHTVGIDYGSDVGLAALDVDKDGWTDLICSGVWFHNTGRPAEEAFERMEFDSAGGGAHDVVIADMNADGKPDVVLSGDKNTTLNGIYWYDIPDNPHHTWPRHYIGESVHGSIAPGGVADINKDGLPDVISATCWYENRGDSWIAHNGIPMGRKGPWGVCVRTIVADMDNDGKEEVVMCEADLIGSKMAILYPQDAQGLSWEKKELPQSFEYGSLHSLAVADFNGDGFLDIVSNEQEELLPEGRNNPRWVIWLNHGEGNYTEHIILDKQLGGHELQVQDVDGDGDIDIYSKAWGVEKWNGIGGKMHVDYLENKLK